MTITQLLISLQATDLPGDDMADEAIFKAGYHLLSSYDL